MSMGRICVPIGHRAVWRYISAFDNSGAVVQIPGSEQLRLDSILCIETMKDHPLMEGHAYV
jgi:hypothetical protein